LAVWRGKDFTATLRRLMGQVRQRAAMGCEEGELLRDGFRVE
jgi:hypothetical protein